MLTRFRKHLTYANVVSTLCLFILLGGSAVAAVSLKRNAVKNRHIAKNAVTAPKVKNASLLSEDFAPGQLPQGEKGNTGDTGQRGERGPSFGEVAPAAVDATTNNCDTTTLSSEPLSVTAPSRVFASGMGEHRADTATTNLLPSFKLALKDSGGSVVAEVNGNPYGEASEIRETVAGVMQTVPDSGETYVAPAGNYTLEMRIRLAGGCAGSALGTSHNLSYVLLGNG
jgi:hypothetical protein